MCLFRAWKCWRVFRKSAAVQMGQEEEEEEEGSWFLPPSCLWSFIFSLFNFILLHQTTQKAVFQFVEAETSAADIWLYSHSTPKKTHHEALRNPDTLSDNNLSVFTEQRARAHSHTHTAAVCAACVHLVAECQPPLNTCVGARTSTHARTRSL